MPLKFDGAVTTTITVLPAVIASDTWHVFWAVFCTLTLLLTRAIVDVVPNDVHRSGYGPRMFPVPKLPPVPGLLVLTVPVLIWTAFSVAACVAQPAGIQLVPT